MADFETQAELSITIPDRQISAARSQIQTGLSDIEVGITPSMAGGPTAQQPRDPSTGQFMSIEGVEQRVIEQTEAQVELLDDIKDAVEGGGVGIGGGGGGGGTNIIPLGGLGAASGAAGAVGGAGALAAAPFLFGGLTLGALSQDEQLNRELRRAEREGQREIPEGAPGAGVGVDPAAARMDPPPEPEWVRNFNPQLQLPPGIPPELEIPQGFPPELGLPTTDWPPELQVPQAPQWARDLIDIFGGPSGASIDVSADVSRTIDANVDFLPNPQEIIDDVLGEVEPQVEDAQQEIDNLRNELERALGL